MSGSRKLRAFFTAERDNLIAQALQLQERIDHYEELLDALGGEAAAHTTPRKTARNLQKRIVDFCQQAGATGLSDDNLLALLSSDFPDLSLRKIRSNAAHTNALVCDQDRWYFIEPDEGDA